MHELKDRLRPRLAIFGQIARNSSLPPDAKAAKASKMQLVAASVAPSWCRFVPFDVNSRTSVTAFLS